MTDTRGAFKDHFSGHAARYAAFRPTYPGEFTAFLAEVAPGRTLALDCGCGSGQLSGMLAAHFDRVVATDASPEQIARAAPHARVQYRVAPAEASGLPAGSVDLVTAAQAAHWFDMAAFNAEARRVLRPRGVVALVSYGPTRGDPDIDRIVIPFYRDVLGPYWPPERKIVESGYRTLPFPFEPIEPPEIDMRQEWSLAEFLGYIETWSATARLQKAGEGGAFPRFAEALGAAWGDAQVRRTVRWPLALRVGRV